MNDGKHGGVLVPIAAACIGAFVAIWWLDYAVVRADWCEGAKVSCFREWMSASSGWVAAIVAIVVAAVTFIPLRQQVAEAKRQTDFTVGDQPPSIDAVIHFVEPEDVVITITNWNRRSLLIHKIEIPRGDFRTGLWRAEIDDVDMAIAQGPNLHPPIIVRGWLKRGEAPHLLKVRAVLLDDLDEPLSDWTGNHSAEITMQIVGDPRGERVEIVPVLLVAR